MGGYRPRRDWAHLLPEIPVEVTPPWGTQLMKRSVSCRLLEELGLLLTLTPSSLRRQDNDRVPWPK